MYTTDLDGVRQLISTNFFRQLKATANFDIILQISQFDSIFRHFLTNFDSFRADSTSFFDIFRLFIQSSFDNIFRLFSTVFFAKFRQISPILRSDFVERCRLLSMSDAVDVDSSRLSDAVVSNLSTTFLSNNKERASDAYLVNF